MKCSNCGDSSGVVAIDGSTSLCSKSENVAFDQNEDSAFASQPNPAKEIGARLIDLKITVNQIHLDNH